MAEGPTAPGREEQFRSSFDTFLRGNSGVSLFAPDAVWDMSRQGVGVFEGRDAIGRFTRDWVAAFEDFASRVEEFLDLGNGVTFAAVAQEGRPPSGSGLLKQPYGIAMQWHDGLIQRATVFTDIDEARAAAEQLAETQG